MNEVDWVLTGAGADWALTEYGAWIEAGTGAGVETVAWNALEAVVEDVAGVEVLLTLVGVADLGGTGVGGGDLTSPESAS